MTQPNRLIRVDVYTGKIYQQALKEDYTHLGGRGLTAKLVAEEVPSRADPLGKENKLVIAPGLFAGTPAPSSGRLSFGAKSPLTGNIKESNAGG
ncbi:MAG: aldehyde ferredoxin oxidoreductase, partial [Clostridia bacterium]|nr:aldehyde ferredoxin oxidoreductase [Clostridia bacterium]